MRAPLIAALLLVILCLADAGRAEPLRLAVASNFTSTAQELAAAFTAATGHEVRLSSASTGTLFAQIVNGAPFDLFLAADAERPALLEARGLIQPGSRFTYAIGRLVLWSAAPQLGPGDCRQALEAATGRIALANPGTAPYGAAARETLVALGLWDRVRARLVYGENIAQTFQFVATGNAELGFVAGSQADQPGASCRWEVPPELHAPIGQQAVQLARASDNAAARAFRAYLQGAEGRAIVRRHGYRVSPDG